MYKPKFGICANEKCKRKDIIPCKNGLCQLCNFDLKAERKANRHSPTATKLSGEERKKVFSSLKKKFNQKSNHKQIYFDFFGYDSSSFIPCEICEKTAVDIHHIESRGRGGDKTGEKNIIENLMALCRKCHTEFGDKKELKEKLKSVHNLHILTHGNHQ